MFLNIYFDVRPYLPSYTFKEKLLKLAAEITLPYNKNAFIAIYLTLIFSPFY